MTRSKFLITIIGVLFFITSFQTTTQYPQGYFRSPVDHAMKLSGTFGELRPNHFHAGLDIKPFSPGKTGQKLYCVAEGYVSRIKISSGGYGNCLYVDHPNGYTSVYAHLKKFPDKVAKFVKDQQYAQQKHQIEIFPGPGELSFTKGEVIGYMGVSGSSFGAHLHFEIRDTRTEKPINPLLFGLKVTDTVEPKLHQIKLYQLSDKHDILSSKTINLTKGNSTYLSSPQTITMGAWRIGVAIKAYDHMNGISNWNGVYSIDMLVDDALVFKTEMETFSFDETRYINTYMDYPALKKDKAYFHRCFTLPGNLLSSVYKKQENNGVFPIFKDKKTKVDMIIKDAAGNTSKLRFYVKRGEVKPMPEEEGHNYLLPYNEASVVNQNGLDLYFPSASFYETTPLNILFARETSAGIHSPTYTIGDKYIPAHKYFDIRIIADQIPESLRDHAFIAYCVGDRVYNCGGNWEGGNMMSSTVRNFGKYAVMTDTRPPIIKASSFKNDLTTAYSMSWKVSDNFGASGKMSDYKSYDAFVDGKWVLLEYDAKNKLLIHKFDERIPKGSGTHTLEILVTDNANNTGVYAGTFKR